MEENSDDGNSSQCDSNRADGKEPRDIEVHNVFIAALSSDPSEPKSIGEALQGYDRLKWIEAIENAIENFLKRRAC